MKTQTIEWKPFSQKHKRYISKAIKSKMSVAEGSIRSGKTIDNCIIASMYLETCKDKIHLASGSSLPNAKLNIGDCNGFGLEHLFRGRCRWGKYKSNECLYIDTKTGQKIVVFAGGGKADSYKKILGNSYGLWIATEINEHYDNEDSRTSFIKVAMGRQVASIEPKMIWDLNPCSPSHKIYKDYIDKYKEGYLGGYNYEHFTLTDNLSITPERLLEIKSQYDEGSIWYKRDILGERCVAEGLVYPKFAERTQDYILPDNFNYSDIMMCNIGVDFGGSGSATAFSCVGFTKRFECVIILESERHTQELNPTELENLYADFVDRCTSLYGKAMNTYADSAEQILIRGLRNVARSRGLRTNIVNARKMPILDRIRLVNKLIGQGRFKVNKRCYNVIDAFRSAVWDKNKQDVRLDNGSVDMDSIDCIEYSIEPFYKELSDYIVR